MNHSPSLHQPELLDWEASRQKLSVHADRRFIFSIVNMEMRAMVLRIIGKEHFNNNVIKPAQLRHAVHAPFKIHSCFYCRLFRLFPVDFRDSVCYTDSITPFAIKSKSNLWEVKLLKRRMIQIDEEKCNGCGACAAACHEGAITMADGKAKLLRDDYCDGLGDCLPACPAGAIRFVEREAAPYDEAAVQRHKQERDAQLSGGCPGSRARQLPDKPDVEDAPGTPASELRNWPVQLKLAPVRAPYFEGADLLIAADCSAFACGAFHQKFLKGRIALIGCPKLDEGDYTEKLTAIFQENEIEKISLVRMEVPCCGGLFRAVQSAIVKSGKDIPLTVTVLSAEGDVLAVR